MARPKITANRISSAPYCQYPVHMSSEATISPERVILAAPRGYCAGVDRAVQTVEQALDKHGAPVYVRKEIVHNKAVVENFKALPIRF